MNTDPPTSPPCAESKSLPVPAPAVGPAAEGGAAKSRGKATNREVNDRVYQVSQMLARALPKHQIKRFLKEKYGIRWRMSDEYIRRARALMRERIEGGRNDLAAELVEFYRGIVRNPDAGDRDKLEAVKGLRELLGVDAPKKIAATTPDGKEAAPLVNIDIKRLTIEQKRAALGIMMALGPPLN